MRCDCVAYVNDADKHGKNLVMETACAKPTVIPQAFKPLIRAPVATISVPEPHDPFLYEVLVAGTGTTGVHLASPQATSRKKPLPAGCECMPIKKHLNRSLAQ